MIKITNSKVSNISILFKRIMMFFIFALSVQNVFGQGAVCGSATPIALGSCTGIQTMTDFTAEASSPVVTCAVGTFRREGWYSFTVPAGPSQNITVAGTSQTVSSDLIIQIISGTCAAETQAACANFNVGSFAQTEQAILTTGLLAVSTTYFVRIMSYGSAVNMVMDNICVNATPSNNNCGAPISLTPSGNCTAASPIAGTLVGATMTNVPGSACNQFANNDVWYTFVATAATHAVTVIPSATMDADFEIFELSCSGLNIPDVTGVYCENLYGVGGTEFGSFPLLTPGNIYYIRVFDDNTSVAIGSTFTISVTTLSNDECSSAITLTSNPACVPTSGCTDNATDSFLAPAGCAGAATADDDVWYQFVATGASHLVTVAATAGFTPVLEVYSDCAGTLVAGGCAVGASGATISSLVTGLTATLTYYVRVYDFGVGVPTATTFTICIGNPPPANDNCTGAYTITPNCLTTLGTSMLNGNVVSATQSLAATCTVAGTANDDVWYTFTTTGTASQPYLITVIGSASFDAVIQVYSGSCGLLTNVSCSNLTGIGATETLTLTTGVALTATTQYWIRVYDATTAAYPATTTFSIAVTLPPVNDNCAGTALTVNVGCTNVAGNVCGATASGVAACTGTPTGDVWYRFVATAATHIITVTPCATMNPVIQVFSGSCGGTSISCTNVTAAGVVETVTQATTATVTYWIRVYDFTGAPGCTAFAICISTPPVNDNCTGAITLTPVTTCGAGTSGTDAGASLSPTAVSACGGNANDDVWYTFTAASANQTITVTPCASYNAVIELYSGTCAGLTLVTGGCVNASGAGIAESLVMTTLTPLTVYYIRVYDFGAGYPACNTFSICVVTPFNDFCANAIAIACPSTTTGATGAASVAGEPSICPSTSVSGIARGLWYVFAGTGQNITANTCGGTTNYDTQLFCFSGSCAALTCVTGNDDQNGACGLTSLITFGTVVGVNYYIFVNGYAGATGNFTLTISCATPPANDQCAGAISVSCGGTLSSTTATASGVNDITGCGTATAVNPVALWYVYNGVDNYNAGDSTYITVALSGCNFGPSSNTAMLAVWQAPNACTVPYWTATAGMVGGLPLSTSTACCGGTFICKAGVSGCNSVTFLTYFGVRYFIEVYGTYVAAFSGSQRGTFTLTITSGTNPLTGLSGCAPLPISLLSFTGMAQGAQNLLEWTTATETNNDFFSLEKSNDGIDFNTFFVKAGAGSSISRNSYSAYDEEPNNGITYYRLKQTDYNGAYTYSNIIAIENNRSLVTLANVHPNPTTNDVNFDFFTSIKGKVHISIADYLGRIVAEEDQNAAIGNSVISAKMAQLPKGVYSLKVSFDQTGYISVSKVVKN